MNYNTTIIDRFENSNAKLIVSCEDPNTAYVDLGDMRLIFKNGEYFGWYNHN